MSIPEIEKSIKKMKTGKAMDSNGTGITSEHFKLATEKIIPTIVRIVNTIFMDKDVTKNMKTGIITPVLNKNKDGSLPGHYRDITVTNTCSSIVESILTDIAFIVTECIMTCIEEDDDLFLITFDAQKTFDKLNHEILFNKLYHDGITDDLWTLFRNMYRDMSVQVKWNNKLTDKIPLEQGIRQRSTLSPVLYKRCNITILNALQASGLGAHIGNINVSSPTCADDIALLGCKGHELQALLDIVQYSIGRGLVTINPAMSEIVNTVNRLKFPKVRRSRVITMK